MRKAITLLLSILLVSSLSACSNNKDDSSSFVFSTVAPEVYQSDFLLRGNNSREENENQDSGVLEKQTSYKSEIDTTSSSSVDESNVGTSKPSVKPLPSNDTLIRNSSGGKLAAKILSSFNIETGSKGSLCKSLKELKSPLGRNVVEASRINGTLYDYINSYDYYLVSSEDFVDSTYSKFSNYYGVQVLISGNKTMMYFGKEGSEVMGYLPKESPYVYCCVVVACLGGNLVLFPVTYGNDTVGYFLCNDTLSILS